MSQSLREALERSGVAEVARKQAMEERVATEFARKARNANLLPHQRWWQNFRLPVTPFEIKVFIKVQCEQWTEGIEYIVARNLNRTTTRCRTKSEAIRQLRAKILAWEQENVLQADVEPPAGALLYWRIYDKEED